MRILFVLALVGGGICIAGCLSAEKQARIDALATENLNLAEEVKALVEKGKRGELTTGEVMGAVGKIQALISKNATEIKDIKDSSSTMAVIGGIAGALARTGLHAVASALPATGPIGLGLQAVLTLLLGGSSTAKKGAAPTPTQ